MHNLKNTFKDFEIFDKDLIPEDTILQSKKTIKITQIILVISFIFVLLLLTQKESNFELTYNIASLTTITAIFNYLGSGTLFIIPFFVVITFYIWNMDKHPFLTKVIHFFNNIYMLSVILGTLAAFGAYLCNKQPEGLLWFTIKYEPSVQEKLYIYYDTLIMLINKYGVDGLFDDRLSRIMQFINTEAHATGVLSKVKSLTVSQIHLLACNDAENLINNIPKKITPFSENIEYISENNISNKIATALNIVSALSCIIINTYNIIIKIIP